MPRPMDHLIIFCLGLIISVSEANHAENVLTTKVHITEINPSFFNWSAHAKQDFWFRASLVGYPDLPGWLSYIYSSRLKTGFLYGVPPDNPKIVKVEVVALNRDTYETKRRIISYNITEKPDRARYEVQLKIDNVNVDDLFDETRLSALKEVLVGRLWPASKEDLYMTFLQSAVSMGARRPLSPHENEGVVVVLGSGSQFSTQLAELEDEVRPLWKLSSCPRDFKRTTVDRHFRAAGFALDWCQFRLEVSVREGEVKPPAWQSEAAWQLPARSLLPSRPYSSDFLASTVVPLTILLVLLLLLSFILCFHHDTLGSEQEEEAEEKLETYEAVQRATSTLRSMSNNRDTDSMPRLQAKVDEDVCRPSPPPYGATRRMLSVDS